MRSSCVVPYLRTLAPILFVGFVADGTALCITAPAVAAPARLALEAALPALIVALAALVLCLDGALGPPDNDDGGGGGGSASGPRPDPGGEPAWWPAFEREFRDYASAYGRSSTTAVEPAHSSFGSPRQPVRNRPNNAPRTHGSTGD
jgi:hypothetical protein